MKILRVIPSMDPKSGGPCQGIRNSIPELEKIGFHNEVVSLDDPDASFLKYDSFEISPLGSGKGPWKYNPKLIPWLEENILRFDVVIVHGLWLYYGFAVRSAFQNLQKRELQNNEKSSKIPKVLVMPHGMLDPYFQRAPGRKLKAIRNYIYWKLVENKLLNSADGILFTCEIELLLARKTFSPYQPKQEFNTGYGIIEPPSYTSVMQEAFVEKCPEIRKSPYLLFISRIQEKKGVDILIQAYSSLIVELMRENGNIPLLKSTFPKLVIAGPGLESAYGNRLHKFVTEDLRLRENILFPGMLEGDAKWGAFYGCEAFVLPSHQENFGIAVVEAMACSKPVLISNQVNIWKEIQTSSGGLVADDTLEGTKELLARWSGLTPKEKSSMGEMARQSFEKHFAIGPAAKRLSDVLLKVVEDK